MAGVKLLLYVDDDVPEERMKYVAMAMKHGEKMIQAVIEGETPFGLFYSGEAPHLERSTPLHQIGQVLPFQGSVQQPSE